MNAKHGQQINFALQGVTTEQFSLNANIEKISKDFGLQSGFEIKLDPDKKILGIFNTAIFKQEDVELVKLVSACHFQIDPDSWTEIIDAQNHRITFDKGFMAHLAMITIGTARGILHAKVQNTKYANVFIPIINVEEIFNEDVSFSTATNSLTGAGK